MKQKNFFIEVEKTIFIKMLFSAAFVFIGVSLVAPVQVEAAYFGTHLTTNQAIIAPGESTTLYLGIAYGTATPYFPFSCSGQNISSFEFSDDGNGGGNVQNSIVVSPSVTTVYTLACTDALGESVSAAPLTVTVSSVPVVTMNADPAVLPTGGGRVRIDWQIGNATSCTQSGGTTEWMSLGNMHLGGNFFFDITAATTFSLSCSNATGNITSGSVTVPVGDTPPPVGDPICGDGVVNQASEQCDPLSWGGNIFRGECPAACSMTCQKNNCSTQPGWNGPLDFRARGGTTENMIIAGWSYLVTKIKKGESVVLEWTGGDVIPPLPLYSNDGNENWQGTLNFGPGTVSGSQEIVPGKIFGRDDTLGMHRYTMGDFPGPTTSVYKREVLVLVEDPPVITLQAAPNRIDAGQSSVLKIDVTNVTECTLRARPWDAALLAYDGQFFNVPGKEIHKEISVTPAKSTKYTLKCKNTVVSGENLLNSTVVSEATQDVTVFVNGTLDPATTNSFFAEPGSINSGQKSTLKWEIVNGADLCFLYDGAISVIKGQVYTRNAQGTLTLAPDEVRLWYGNPLQKTALEVSPTKTTTYTFLCWGVNDTMMMTTVIVDGVNPTDPTGGGGGGPTSNTTCATPGSVCQSGTSCSEGKQKVGSCNGGLGSCCMPKRSDGGRVGTSDTQAGLINITNPLDFDTVEGLLNSILGFLQGIIAILSLIMIVIGSLIYMTAAGDEKKMGTGKMIITASLIGLALALAAPSFLKQIGEILGWGTTDGSDVAGAKTILEILQTALNFLLSVVGIIAIIMLVFGGFTYLASAGDENKAETGKKIVTYAIIAIAVALSALVLVTQVAKFF